jgi:hypothetical protein
MSNTQPSSPKSGPKFSKLSLYIVALLAISLISDRILILIKVSETQQLQGISALIEASFRIPQFLTGMLVPILLLWALWDTAQLMRRLEQGLGFQEQVTRALHKIGGDLLYAALAAILIVPTLDAWIAQQNKGFDTKWDVVYVAIGMIGIVMRQISRQAKASQEQLDSIV